MIDPRQPNFASTPVAPDRAPFDYAPDLASTTHKPAATIVTPFFNTRKVFHATARSVLGQSLQNFEWIIVNDASTDPESLEALDRYRAAPGSGRGKDPRVRIIDHRVNHGLPAARNTGFRAARSDFIFQLDSDDLIEPTAVEKCLLTLLARPECAFVKGFTVGFGAQEYLWEKGFHDGDAFCTENLATATAMVRRSVHERIGGCDETLRRGMEDWDFWLRCADDGLWGDTIPEFLDWYRRRANQHAAWDDLASGDRVARFRERLTQRCPRAFSGDFPRAKRPWHMPYQEVPPTLDLSNPLAKKARRFLMIVPWLRMGGADRFNLDLIRYLRSEPGGAWEVTVVALNQGHHWLPEFSRLTPDVFMLGHYGPVWEHPRMLRYLIESRRPDVVMVTNTELGYLLLPYLRSASPSDGGGPSYVDFNHMEEPHWKNGGHPRSGIAFQDQLDLNIVVSGHLKKWMVDRGGDESRIEVCHINADAQLWKPDDDARARTRDELSIPDGHAVILYAARLCPQKQPLVFARTIAELHRRAKAESATQPRTPFLALVAGDGEDQAALESELDRFRLRERGVVRMLGPQPADAMPALMAASDIFFLPSKWEGIALSFYEAMAAALPIVGADVGGQRELVTPETGILLPGPASDPEREMLDYADALAALIDDPARRAALGRAARERILTHFELANMGRRMSDLIEQALANRRERPRQVLSRGLAHEMAAEAVEYLRVHELADWLWPLHESRLAAERDRARRAEEAAAALAHIEGSRSWRLVQGLKQLPPYPLLARARFGPDWRMVDHKEPPESRLDRIRRSRSFRLLQTMKRLPPWSIYTRVHHGERAH